jgi:hypothetical protein
VIANLQNLLLYKLKGISCYVKPLIEQRKTIDKQIVKFVENELFITLTNVNFDTEFHVKFAKQIVRNLFMFPGGFYERSEFVITVIFYNQYTELEGAVLRLVFI